MADQIYNALDDLNSVAVLPIRFYSRQARKSAATIEEAAKMYFEGDLLLKGLAVAAALREYANELDK